MSPGAATSTPEERRLAKYRRYNASKKGQDRDKKYEDAHPERAQRWSVEMALRKNGK
jgi:hypothetical protein